jgi:ATP-dependent Clp endopeptidase proteolytic subunit ClpP
MNTIIIENKSGKVKLNESVTRQSITRLVDEIGKLFGASASASGADFGEIMNAAENAVDTLEIEINSPGGSVFDGFTIYQEIKSLRDRGVVVNATITGMAASMASVICMACDHVAIVPHGRMMIHDASNTVAGNADYLRKSADLLDSISADLANIYAAKTGKPADEIRTMMKAETWMNASESVANGFADTVLVSASVEITELLNHDSTSDNMNFFLTNKQALEKIAGFESRVSELENEITAATATIEALQADAVTASETINSLTSERDKASAALATAQATVADQEQTIAEANEKLASFDSEVASKVQLGIANLGFKGEIPDAKGDETDSIVSLEKFNSFNPTQKMAFVKSGGKIQD